MKMADIGNTNAITIEKIVIRARNMLLNAQKPSAQS